MNAKVKIAKLEWKNKDRKLNYIRDRIYDITEQEKELKTEKIALKKLLREK